MGLLFNRGSDDGSNDGCTAHHFGEYESKPTIDLRERFAYYTDKGKVDWSRRRGPSTIDTFYSVYQKTETTCQHENCDETRVKYERIGAVEDVASLSVHPRERVVERIKEEVDDE